MQIIQVPHPRLRKTSNPVKEVNTDLLRFLDNLSETLEKKRNPRGVGLSAPQVDNPLSAFVTYLENEHDNTPVMRTFINPQIIKSSDEKTLGDDLKKPILEGCLSIPNLYGPVPRWTWVEFEFDEIKDGKLQRSSERFYDFTARVMQHEYDHLHGKLFTDYILEFEFPLYNDASGKLVEIDRTIAEKF